MGNATHAMEFDVESFMHLFVRLATAADVDALLQFYVTMWQATYVGVINNDFLLRLAASPQVHTCFINMLTTGRESARILLAFDGDKIVGMAIGGPYRLDVEPGHAENYALYIDPAYQGKGLGRYLWLKRARMLQALGAHMLHTWVLAPNKDAQVAYERWGAKPGAPWSRTVQFGDQEMEEVHYTWDLNDPANQAALTEADK